MSNSATHIKHSYRTAQSLTLALSHCHQAGIAPEVTRGKLPEGIGSVQELDERQSREYLADLCELYKEAMKSKSPQPA